MRPVPDEREVLTWFDRYSNWDRWGAGDLLGTLNLITTEKRRAAAALVRHGLTVSCARPVEFQPSRDVPVHFARRYMGRTNALPDAGTAESVLLGIHGGGRTHLDSPAHVFWKSQMFGGTPTSVVTTEDGATIGAIDLARDGIVTRGVLLDVAGLRRKEWLEPGEAIHPEDLEDAERASEVQVREGDALLVRTGHARRRLVDPIEFGRWPGLHATCIPWLHQRGVAVLAMDCGNDAAPSGYPNIASPIHKLALVALGLWLVDNCDLERVADSCRGLGTFEFLFVVSPLVLPNVSGSPVNPLALL